MKKLGLIFIGLILFQLHLLGFEKPKITIIDRQAESLKFNIIDQNPELQFIAVMREADTKEAQPILSDKYEASAVYDTSKKKSFSGPGNLIVKVHTEFSGDVNGIYLTVSGLKPNTDYSLDLYYFKPPEFQKKSKLFKTEMFTSFPKPTKQSKSVLYKNLFDKGFDFIWTRGDGNGCIVVMKKGKSEITPPVNGRTYKSAQFGKGDKTDKDSSYVIYNGKDNKLSLEGLESNTSYSIQIFEYNGKDEKINYLTEGTSLNPSYKTTMLETPVLMPAENFKPDGFLCKWSKVPGADIYELDVATDPEFRKMLIDFETMDVGNLTEYQFEEVPKGTYFIRVRAFGNKNTSLNSKPIQVILD